ncbi:MAG: phosphate signaling complex protein PhoU [Rhodomicrobium sp.]
MDDHTAKAFDADLREISAKVQAMAQLIEQQVSSAGDVLGTGDTLLAQQIIAVDNQVDALQREIEEKAVITIARRQPVAVDLREVVGALRISNDLERIGDLAQNVAKRAVLSAEEFRAINGVTLRLQQMTGMVVEQLQNVMQSYVTKNAGTAVEVWRADQEVDALNNSLFRELLTYMMENPRNITFCTHMLFCAKNIERMGDHATNIAETVFYMVNGTSLPGDRPKADVTSLETLPPA